MKKYMSPDRKLLMATEQRRHAPDDQRALKVLHSALIEIVRIRDIRSSRSLEYSKVSQIPARPARPAFTATFLI